MTDLKERLREYCKFYGFNIFCEAADAIERLEKDATDIKTLVWWIAMLAKSYPEPEVGDWVVEKSHLIGIRNNQSSLRAIGRIKEKGPNSSYLLELLDGTQLRWDNALMCKLPAIDAAKGER